MTSAGPDQRQQRLKIGVVSQYFWPETFPINPMAQILRARGHDVTVVTGLPNYPSGRLASGYGWRGPWREQFGDINVRRLPLVARGSGSRIGLAANYLSFALTSALGVPGILRRGVDVVLALQASPLLGIVGGLTQKAVFGTPLVTWIQDLWPDSLEVAGIRSPLAWRSMDRLMRATYRRSDAILMQSSAFRAHAERYGVPAEKTLYVPNWADPAYRPLDEKEFAAERAELPNGFRIVLAGNIGEAQDIETVIAVARLLKGHPAIRICVFGDGRMRPALEEAIARETLFPTLQWLGPRPFDQMPRYFSAADALLLTLRSNPTMAMTIPSRLQAYMACGRPIIAALDGEASRIVTENGAGLGVGAGQPEALRDAILALWRMSSEERRVMAERALRCSQTEFNASHIVDRVEACLYRVVHQAGNTP